MLVQLVFGNQDDLRFQEQITSHVRHEAETSTRKLVNVGRNEDEKKNVICDIKLNLHLNFDINFNINIYLF